MVEADKPANSVLGGVMETHRLSPGPILTCSLGLFPCVSASMYYFLLPVVRGSLSLAALVQLPQGQLPL